MVRIEEEVWVGLVVRRGNFFLFSWVRVILVRVNQEFGKEESEISVDLVNDFLKGNFFMF